MTKKRYKDRFADEIPFYPNGSVPWKKPQRSETHFNAYYDCKSRKHIFNVPINWKENKPFKAGIRFKEVDNRRSSVRFLVENTETGAIYYVSRNSFQEMMKFTTWILGVCVGEWVFESHRGYLSIVPANRLNK